MLFQDKIVWITGASSGIGEALAYHFIDEGAKIILSARRQKELIRVAGNRELFKEKILVLPIDLENTVNIKEKVNLVYQRFGRIDILVNNGGIGHKTKAIETPSYIDRKVMEINFFGTINLTKEVVKIMKIQNGGKIIVVSSIMGKHGWPYYSTYCASKHALYGYFESLRQELFQDSIQILIVSPGYIATNISEKFLLEDGSTYGKKNISGYGISPKSCAEKIIKAVKDNRDHIFIGRWEIFWLYVKQYFPTFFYRRIRKRYFQGKILIN